MDEIAFVDKITTVVPSPRQIEWQAMEYYSFIHFNMSTMINRQWGNGKTSPRKFNPQNIDTDEWARVLKDSGSSGVILTVKHHDGFCLYPSKHTAYTIAASPYKGGKGDLVRELSDSARKYGLKFGVYLSPWDMHEKTYGSPVYNDYFCNQLTELLTNYGDIFCIWLDGACGSKRKQQVYDFTRYFELVRQLQPRCVLSICGCDVRWIGNEGGQMRESEWSVVPAKYCTYDAVNSISQQSDSFKFINKPMEAAVADLGSRKALMGEEELTWYPSEMDISITTEGFFYNKKSEVKHLSTSQRLMDCYLKSVGHNSTLLLNVPPDRDGVIKPEFVKVLQEFKEMRDKMFSRPAQVVSQEVDGKDIIVKFATPTKVTSVVLAEDIARSQRVESYTISGLIGRIDRAVAHGHTIGYKEIKVLGGDVYDGIKITIDSCRGQHYLLPVTVYS